MALTEQLPQNGLPKRVRGAGEQVPQKNLEQIAEEHTVAAGGLRAVRQRLTLGRLASSREVQAPSDGIDRKQQASKFRRIVSRLPIRVFEQSQNNGKRRADTPVSYFGADKNYQPSHKAEGGKHALELTDAKTVREVFQNDIQNDKSSAARHARPMFSYEISAPADNVSLPRDVSVPESTKEAPPSHRGVQGQPRDAEGNLKEYPEYEPGGAHRKSEFVGSEVPEVTPLPIPSEHAGIDRFITHQ